MLSVVPIMAAAGFCIHKVTSRYSQMELDTYAVAGAIAEEVLSSIKTVISFNGQKEEINLYEKTLEKSREVGIKKSIATGASIGMLFCLIFCLYGFTFWYGAKLILVESYTIGRVMILLFR
jgi:ATP-binding cassette subfamily B (MDR/TAP) protein 1